MVVVLEGVEHRASVISHRRPSTYNPQGVLITPEAVEFLVTPNDPSRGSIVFPLSIPFIKPAQFASLPRGMELVLLGAMIQDRNSTLRELKLGSGGKKSEEYRRDRKPLLEEVSTMRARIKDLNASQRSELLKGEHKPPSIKPDEYIVRLRDEQQGLQAKMNALDALVELSEIDRSAREALKQEIDRNWRQIRTFEKNVARKRRHRRTN